MFLDGNRVRHVYRVVNVGELSIEVGSLIRWVAW